MNESTAIHNGLDGIVAAETSLSMVDGSAGELVIAGYPVAELAMNAAFEETTHLLWYGHLPDEQELTVFRADLGRRRELPPVAYELLQVAARERADSMDALRMAAGTISLRGSSQSTDKSVCATSFSPRSPDKSACATSSSDKSTSGANHRGQCGTDTLVCAADDEAARNLLTAFPTIVATYWRMLNDRSPIAPRPDLGHAANFLYMLSGEIASDERVRGLETYLNTVVDHGLNASTFTARVIASTGSDLVSAIVGAIGALKGPLHGGAPGPALDMVFEIGTASRAEEVLRKKIESGQKLMGFGHRVYKVRDPRADVLAAAAERMFTRGGDMALYDLARAVEAVALRLLEEYKPGRNLQTNVEFYTALLLHGLDLEVPLFTPTFAVSRVAGWIAHCFEQRLANRIIRPQSVYRGDRDRRWVPPSARATQPEAATPVS
ncbi:MAG TPA: citrate synthase/methylcitrate synthase [Thermoanaerobaculia bacterium]|jgi:citrate synthase|nr:citrate synthase/methylcitrate synthase [Thermoanaerobaculia bacterium]